MSTHTAQVEWERHGSAFTDNRYSRAHVWRFDGGITVPASSSPQVVPVPYSDAGNVDPEEAFVAALASCHMLWFLGLAAAQGYVIDRYCDAATATMARNAQGRQWLERLVLNPHVAFGGPRVPTDEAVGALHHAAHEACFLANSVKTEIAIAGQWEHRP